MNVAAIRVGLKNNTVKTILVGVGIIAILAGIKSFQIWQAIKAHSGMGPPPETVTSIVATETTWPRTIPAMGSLLAVQGVTLSAEAEGRVAKVSFESGDKAESGQVLIELDSSVEEANLKAARALADQARSALTRAKTLRAQNANSQSDLESAAARAAEAEGAAESLAATIARRKAVAPFAGRTGIRMVNVGQYVSKGTPLVPLYSEDALYLDIWLPQENVRDVALGQKVRLTVDSLEGNFEGSVTAIDPAIDPDTRTLRVQATIPNTEHKLRSGMFVHAVLELTGSDKVIAVPNSSVSYAPYGDTVYVIEKQEDPTGKELRKVRQQVVKVGPKLGSQVAILGGLKPGEEIVTSGTFKLRPGLAVIVNNQLAPVNEIAPHTSDT